MTALRRLKAAGLAGLTWLVVTGPAAGAAVTPPERWLGLPIQVWAWANLVVFWGALFYFAGPALRSFLVRRREGIQADLDNAARQRTEAEEMRSGLEAKLAELEAEMKHLAQRGEEEGEKEHAQILEQAKQEGERILEQTKGEIDNRVAQAHVELKELTARLAAGLARRRVKERLTAEDRRSLFARDLARLKRRGARGQTS